MIEELKNLSTTTKESITAYYFNQTIDYSIDDLFRALSYLYDEEKRKILNTILKDMLREINEEQCFEISHRYISKQIPKRVTKKGIIIDNMIKAGFIEEVKYKNCLKLSFLGFKTLTNWADIIKFIKKYKFLGDDNNNLENYLTILYIIARSLNDITERELQKDLNFTSDGKLVSYIDFLEIHQMLLRSNEYAIIKLTENGVKCYNRFMAIFEKIKLIDEDCAIFLYNYTPKSLDIVFEQTSEIKKGIERFNQYLIDVLDTNKNLYCESYSDRAIFYMEIEKDCFAEIHVCFIIPPRVVTLYRIFSGEIFTSSQNNELTKEIMTILAIAFTRQSFHSPWMKYTFGPNLDCYIQSDLPFDNINRETIFFILENLFHEVLRFRKEIEPTIVTNVLGKEFEKIGIVDTLLLLQKGILGKVIVKENEKANFDEIAKLFPEVPFAKVHIKDMIKRLTFQDTLISYLSECLPFCFKDAPTAETHIQDYVEILLKAKGYDFNREKKIISYSTRSYRPDFTFDKEKTALEIKFCNNKKAVGRIIKEINDDIVAYQKEYPFLIFLVYDVGGIRDVKMFKRDIEKRNENVRVSVVKH